ncbi:uncharacterized protein BJ171DRAFT_506875 [Polychytrium aggregatum]|uniref:uncharacterized protein n=1 Tax=Polychytrium aggregatum TaxID=110093 RepID=UPI0022FDFA57|nr:uncharacterized protein BJ171DRAFT_506875 [Polychytrium aggregatum]KAI9204296.1 hypothetical protein BJ171DRAFT_506875 [Polychytrium aggregatum]
MPASAPSLSESTLSRASTLQKLLKFKNIGKFGGICFLYCSILGPSVPQIQSLFQQYGYVTISLLFLAFAIISAIGALFIIEAMQCIPGNRHFQGTIEYGTLINFYFSPKMHYVGQLFLYLSLVFSSAVSIIQCIQNMDSIIIDIFKSTCGIGIGNGPKGWHCVGSSAVVHPGNQYMDYGNGVMLVTLGTLVMVMVIVPLSRSSLNDNIYVQIASFFVTIAVFGLWLGVSLYAGATSGWQAISPFGQTPDGGAFGPIMLSYAFITVVPSWVNLKEKSINVQRTIWESVGISFLTYIIVGLIPALAFSIDSNSNLLLVLNTRSLIFRIASYLYVILVLISSIPVYIIVSYDNLMQNKVCSSPVAIVLCYIVPWLLAVPFLGGPWLSIITNWSSVLFVSIANMIIPFVIYLKAVSFRKAYNSKRELTPHQKELLRSIHKPSNRIIEYLDRDFADPSNVGERVLEFIRSLTGSSRTPTMQSRSIHEEPGRGRSSTGSRESRGSVGGSPSSSPVFGAMLTVPMAAGRQSKDFDPFRGQPAALEENRDIKDIKDVRDIKDFKDGKDSNASGVDIDEMLEIFGDVVDPDLDDDERNRNPQSRVPPFEIPEIRIYGPESSSEAVNVIQFATKSSIKPAAVPSADEGRGDDRQHGLSVQKLREKTASLMSRQTGSALSLSFYGIKPWGWSSGPSSPTTAQEVPNLDRPASDDASIRSSPKSSPLDPPCPEIVEPSSEQPSPKMGWSDIPLGTATTNPYSRSSLSIAERRPESLASKPRPQPPLRQQSIDTVSSLRPGTLPIHPQFVTPVFRSLPKSIPISGLYVAYASVLITLAVSVVSVVNLVTQLSQN